MNTEDREIFDLLKEHQTIKAADNFTSNVMDTIYELEKEQSSQFQLNITVAGFLMFAAVLLSGGIIYYFGYSLVENPSSYLNLFSGVFTKQFSWFNNYMMQIVGFIQNHSFIFGIGFMIVALLSFERIILNRRMNINFLSIV